MAKKNQIMIALDFDAYADARLAVDRLDEAVVFKVGLQAFLQFGEDIIRYLNEKQKKLFLDLKFKDIPNTVFGAVKSSFRYSPAFLTIHLAGRPEMIKKAVEAAQSDSPPIILGVTILTSLSDDDLKETGMNLSTKEAVLRLVDLGVRNGVNAFVCSPMEIGPIRERFGSDILLVTPGIRPVWSEKGDQKRIFTPRMAIDAGSNYLVIGRPITGAENPTEAFQRVIDEIGE